MMQVVEGQQNRVFLSVFETANFAIWFISM